MWYPTLWSILCRVFKAVSPEVKYVSMSVTDLYSTSLHDLNIVEVVTFFLRAHSSWKVSALKTTMKGRQAAHANACSTQVSILRESEEKAPAGSVNNCKEGKPNISLRCPPHHALAFLLGPRAAAWPVKLSPCNIVCSSV